RCRATSYRRRTVAARRSQRRNRHSQHTALRGACGKTRVVLQSLRLKPEPTGMGWRMAEHAVVVAGGGPTGLMLAGELALAKIDVAIVERRASPDLSGSRAGGLHARTIEVLDQRGIDERFLAEGKKAPVAGCGATKLD